MLNNNRQQNSYYDIHGQPIWFNSFINSFNIKPNELFNLQYKNNVLPLFTLQKKHNAFLRIITLKALGTGPNDFCLLGQDYSIAQETATSYAEELFLSKTKWDWLELSEIPETDKIINPFITNLRSNKFDVTIDQSKSYYHIDLTKNWEEHYKNHIHKKTLDLRTRVNKLKRDGYNYEVITYTKGIYSYLDKILEYYEQRRKLTSQPNAFSIPQHAQMLKQIVPEYEQMGWLKLSILKGNDGKDWAYQLDFVKDGIQYHYAPTFDMKYAAYSPSKILLLETIKQGFNNPNLYEFNFMRGESDYKKQFAYEKSPFTSIKVYNPFSVRNKMYNMYNKLSHIKLFIKQ